MSNGKAESARRSRLETICRRDLSDHTPIQTSGDAKKDRINSACIISGYAPG